MKYTIDLNCDLGEGTGNDQYIMPHISSCNIACGGHYGNAGSITTAVQLAKHHQVSAGAHPGFDDKANFGRVRCDWSRSRFRESVTRQLKLFKDTATMLQVDMHHIKMHGALYHATAHESDMATWCVELLQDLFPKTPLYGLPYSRLHHLCREAGQPFIAEAFADRAYNSDGSLVSREQPDAVYDDVQQAGQQLVSLAKDQKVRAATGELIEIAAQTYCIHGDNRSLAHSLEKLVDYLNTNEIEVGKFFV
jgi:UPF0271 protein